MVLGLDQYRSLAENGAGSRSRISLPVITGHLANDKGRDELKKGSQAQPLRVVQAKAIRLLRPFAQKRGRSSARLWMQSTVHSVFEPKVALKNIGLPPSSLTPCKAAKPSSRIWGDMD